MLKTFGFSYTLALCFEDLGSYKNNDHLKRFTNYRKLTDCYQLTVQLYFYTLNAILEKPC